MGNDKEAYDVAAEAIKGAEKQGYKLDVYKRQEESYRILVDAIEKLPPQMKSIMQLALEGKSNPEIAETLNISGETVHSQKKIAYRKLRVYLKDYYYLVFYFL